jgi:hypothetical protein
VTLLEAIERATAVLDIQQSAAREMGANERAGDYSEAARRLRQFKAAWGEFMRESWVLTDIETRAIERASRIASQKGGQ